MTTQSIDIGRSKYYHAASSSAADNEANTDKRFTTNEESSDQHQWLDLRAASTSAAGDHHKYLLNEIGTDIELTIYVKPVNAHYWNHHRRPTSSPAATPPDHPELKETTSCVQLPFHQEITNNFHEANEPATDLLLPFHQGLVNDHGLGQQLLAATPPAADDHPKSNDEPDLQPLSYQEPDNDQSWGQHHQVATTTAGEGYSDDHYLTNCKNHTRLNNCRLEKKTSVRSENLCSVSSSNQNSVNCALKVVLTATELDRHMNHFFSLFHLFSSLPIQLVARISRFKTGSLLKDVQVLFCLVAFKLSTLSEKVDENETVSLVLTLNQLNTRRNGLVSFTLLSALKGDVMDLIYLVVIWLSKKGKTFHHLILYGIDKAYNEQNKLSQLIARRNEYVLWTLFVAIQLCGKSSVFDELKLPLFGKFKDLSLLPSLCGGAATKRRKKGSNLSKKTKKARDFDKNKSQKLTNGYVLENSFEKRFKDYINQPTQDVDMVSDEEPIEHDQLIQKQIDAIGQFSSLSSDNSNSIAVLSNKSSSKRKSTQTLQASLSKRARQGESEGDVNAVALEEKRSAVNAKYYQKNKGERVQKARAKYNEKPEPKKAQAKETYQKNPEPKKAQAKETYQKNPEPKKAQTKEASKKTYAENPEPKKAQAKETSKKTYTENPEPKKAQERARYAANSGSYNLEDFSRDLNMFAKQCCPICKKWKLDCQLVSVTKNSVKIDLSLIKDLQHTFLACYTCANYLRKGEVPCQANWNSMDTGETPPQLLVLSEIENRLLARLWPFMRITKVNAKFGQLKIQGQATVFAQDVEEVKDQVLATSLPRNVTDIGEFIVVVSLDGIDKQKRFQVRNKELREGCDWLFNNHPLYSDLKVFNENYERDIQKIVTVEKPKQAKIKKFGCWENQIQYKIRYKLLAGTEDYHQGNAKLFENLSKTTEWRSVAISSASVVYQTLCKQFEYWSPGDLDEILIAGHSLYKNVDFFPKKNAKASMWYSSTEFSETITIFKKKVNLNLKLIEESPAHKFKERLEKLLETHKNLVIKSDASSLAILKVKSKYFIYDCYMRTKAGNKGRTKGQTVAYCCSEFSDALIVATKNLELNKPAQYPVCTFMSVACEELNSIKHDFDKNKIKTIASDMLKELKSQLSSVGEVSSEIYLLKTRQVAKPLFDAEFTAFEENCQEKSLVSFCKDSVKVLFDFTNKDKTLKSFEVIDVTEDENSFFAAISLALFKTEEMSNAIRCLCIKALIKEESSFGKRALSHMCEKNLDPKVKSLNDAVMNLINQDEKVFAYNIFSASLGLNRPLVIDDNLIKVNEHYGENTWPIVLVHKDNFYKCVLPISVNTGNTQIELLQDEDDETIFIIKARTEVQELLKQPTVLEIVNFRPDPIDELATQFEKLPVNRVREEKMLKEKAVVVPSKTMQPRQSKTVKEQPLAVSVNSDMSTEGRTMLRAIQKFYIANKNVDDDEFIKLFIEEIRNLFEPDSVFANFENECKTKKLTRFNEYQFVSDKSYSSNNILKMFEIVNVSGDGNCLYRAVSLSLFSHEDYHEALRCLCIKSFFEHLTYFKAVCESGYIEENSIKELVRKVSTLGIFGEAPCVYALSLLFERKFVLEGRNYLTSKAAEVDSDENVRIFWQNHACQNYNVNSEEIILVLSSSHYRSILPHAKRDRKENWNELRKNLAEVETIHLTNLAFMNDGEIILKEKVIHERAESEANQILVEEQPDNCCLPVGSIQFEGRKLLRAIRELCRTNKNIDDNEFIKLFIEEMRNLFEPDSVFESFEKECKTHILTRFDESQFESDKSYKLDNKLNMFEMVNVSGDGNCFYRALSLSLFGNDSYHEALRCLCIKSFFEHRTFFRIFLCVAEMKKGKSNDVSVFTKMVLDTSTPGKWGEDTNVYALVLLLERKIVVEVQKSNKKAEILQYVSQNVNEATEEILLAFNGTDHYRSILPNVMKDTESNWNQFRNVLARNVPVYLEHLVGYGEIMKEKPLVADPNEIQMNQSNVLSVQEVSLPVDCSKMAKPEEKRDSHLSTSDVIAKSKKVLLAIQKFCKTHKNVGDNKFVKSFKKEIANLFEPGSVFESFEKECKLRSLIRYHETYFESDKSYNLDNILKMFEMVDVVGDGNCFYRAISLSLFGNESYHETIRCLCIKAFFEYRTYFETVLGIDPSNNIFEGSFKELVDNTSTLGIWAEDSCIYALVLVLERRIVVENRRKITRYNNKEIDILNYVSKNVNEASEEIYLAFNGVNHYRSILPHVMRDTPNNWQHLRMELEQEKEIPLEGILDYGAITKEKSPLTKKTQPLQSVCNGESGDVPIELHSAEPLALSAQKSSLPMETEPIENNALAAPQLNLSASYDKIENVPMETESVEPLALTAQSSFVPMETQPIQNAALTAQKSDLSVCSVEVEHDQPIYSQQSRFPAKRLKLDVMPQKSQQGENGSQPLRFCEEVLSGVCSKYTDKAVDEKTKDIDFQDLEAARKQDYISRPINMLVGRELYRARMFRYGDAPISVHNSDSDVESKDTDVTDDTVSRCESEELLYDESARINCSQIINNNSKDQQDTDECPIQKWVDNCNEENNCIFEIKDMSLEEGRGYELLAAEDCMDIWILLGTVDRTFLERRFLENKIDFSRAKNLTAIIANANKLSIDKWKARTIDMINLYVNKFYFESYEPLHGTFEWTDFENYQEVKEITLKNMRSNTCAFDQAAFLTIKDITEELLPETKGSLYKDLTFSIEKFFTIHHHGMVELEGKSYAIFKDTKGYYYLYNSGRCDELGLTTELTGEKAFSCVLKFKEVGYLVSNILTNSLNFADSKEYRKITFDFVREIDYTILCVQVDAEELEAYECNQFDDDFPLSSNVMMPRDPTAGAVEDEIEMIENDEDDDENVDLYQKELNVKNLRRKTDKPVNLQHVRRAEEYIFYDKFPKGINGPKELREIDMTPLKYYQARVFGNDPRFYDVQYLFWALTQYEADAARRGISTCGRMIHGDNNQKNENILASIHLIMSNIRGSYAYFAKLRAEILARIELLGLPDLFLTFSCNDLNWPSMLKAMLLREGKPYTDEDVAKLTLRDRMQLVERNPTVVAQHFNHRVRCLIKYLQKTGIGGYKVKDFQGRIEFQKRGTPHLHILVHLDNFPKRGTPEYNEAMSRIVECTLPDEDSELRKQVLILQKHKCTATCEKRNKASNKNREFEKDDHESCRNNNNNNNNERTGCRFGFPRPISDSTKVVQPDSNEYIRNGYRTLILRRRKEEQWINGYNREMLLVWLANIDIQNADNAKIAKYISEYISKSEPGEISSVVSKAIEELVAGNKTFKSVMHTIMNKMLNKREVGACEAAYRLGGFPLVWSSRACVFINAHKPEKRFRLLKLDKNNPDKNTIHENIIEKYGNRPDHLEHLCLMQFVSWYNQVYVKQTEETLNVDDDDEGFSSEPESTEPVINDKFFLKNSKVQFKKRKKPAAVRSNFFGRMADPESFYYQKLLLYVPFRKEKELLEGFESAAEAFDAKKDKLAPLNPDFEFDHIRDQVETMVMQRELMNDDQQETQGANRNNDDDGFVDGDYTKKNNLPIGERWKRLKDLVKMLNPQQRVYYNLYRQQCKDILEGKKPKPMMNILAGCAGSGKTFLLNVLVEMIQLMFYDENNKDAQYVKVLAPTGVAACLVNGQTIHSGLYFGVDQKENEECANLKGKKLANAISSWKHVQFLFIDEISMISGRRLAKIFQRCSQIAGLGCPLELCGGINFTCIGDLAQLPPIRDYAVYADIEGVPNLWSTFNFCELDQNMRQQGDTSFQTLLNHVREGKLNEQDREMLISRKANADSYTGKFAPEKATHIYPTNAMVREHNAKIIKQVAKDKKVKIYSLVAHDELQNGKLPDGQTMESVTPTDLSKCSGIHKKIEICDGARVMLLKNLNLELGLVNGAFGNITKIVWPHFHKDQMEGELPQYVRIKFDHMDEEINICPGIYSFDGLSSAGIIERRQLPLVLSYAVTVHKLQGCTVSSAVINLGEEVFSRGQPYVALSRVRNLESLLISDLNFRKIEQLANQDALDELKKLRNLPYDGDGRRRL